MSAATRPEVPRTVFTPPSREDIRALLACAEASDPQLSCWLQVAVATGARRGEICALRWADIDLEAATDPHFSARASCLGVDDIDVDPPRVAAVAGSYVPDDGSMAGGSVVSVTASRSWVTRCAPAAAEAGSSTQKL